MSETHNETPNVRYGEDEKTISVNFNQKKAEDWHDDYKGILTIDGAQFWVNLKDKKKDGTWLAGKLVPKG